MPPFLPVINLNHSQSVRVGRGPGDAVPTVNVGNARTKSSTSLRTVFYADLGQPEVRRDIQRHAAIGALQEVGSLALYPWSDLFLSAAVTVAAGTGFSLTIPALTLTSRAFTPTGSKAAVGLTVAAQTNAITPIAPPSAGYRTDIVYVDNNGVGGVAPGVPVTTSDTWTITGSPSGNCDIAFEYNGLTYFTVSTAITTTISAANFLTAVTGALPGTALKSMLPTATGAITTSGGALGTNPITLVSNVGPLSNLRIITASITGCTIANATPGVGGGNAFPGNALPVAAVTVPSTAASSSDYLLTTGTAYQLLA